MSLGKKVVGGFLAVLGVLVVLVPSALAAPPPNDDFANREDLGSGLPVEVERANWEATKESGEPSLGGSGHSIWFQWEATASGLVTVGTCKGTAALRPAIGVFTGTELTALTEVGGEGAGGVGECSSGWGTSVTFRAVAGAEYAIGVDGVASFPGPEGGQGSIDLSLEATPTPVNDAFANATTLDGQILSSGAYSASATGFNWNATKEPGEPNHAGDPGGASVWYAWTAPSSDRYGVLVCGRFPIVWGVYTGAAVNGLTSVTGRGECGMALLDASSGTTYRIAVDGKGNGESASAAMGSFSVNVSRSALAPSFPPERTAPVEIHRHQRKSINGTIRKRRIDSKHRSATFYFRASWKEARFRCQLDRRMPTWCRSPKTYEHLSVGPHEFKVIAIDPTSSGDGTPPIAHFRIGRSR